MKRITAVFFVFSEKNSAAAVCFFGGADKADSAGQEAGRKASGSAGRQRRSGLMWAKVFSGAENRRGQRRGMVYLLEKFFERGAGRACLRLQG